MLGVQINLMLDFQDHLNQVTTDVRQLANILAKRLIFPNRKKQVIEQLLKTTYHATHLGISTYKQLETIDKLLN